MRIALSLLLLATAACAGMRGTAPAARAPLVGIWRVTQVNGRELPAPSPMEPAVTIERASLMLLANGDYTLSITAHGGSEPAGEHNQAGTWAVRENALTLAPASARATRFAYSLAGGALTLRDGQGVVYTLTRS
jgi:hypothetical protein